MFENIENEKVGRPALFCVTANTGFCFIAMSSLKRKSTGNLLMGYAQKVLTNIPVAVSAAKLKCFSKTTCTYEAIQETLRASLSTLPM